jgi:hypothetical protein
MTYPDIVMAFYLQMLLLSDSKSLLIIANDVVSVLMGIIYCFVPILYWYGISRLSKRGLVNDNKVSNGNIEMAKGIMSEEGLSARTEAGMKK